LTALQSAFADDKPFYWAENGQLASYTGLNALQFEDSPNAPLGYFRDDDFKQFETRLVGVKADGTYVSWDSLGTNFVWKSNAVHDSLIGRLLFGEAVYDLVYTAAVDDGTLVTVLAGEVFDIAVVPEPSSLQLLSVGVLVAAILSCRLGNTSKRMVESGYGRRCRRRNSHVL
jgi:hypothetical protein